MHANAELIRKGFEAFNAGDMATIAELLAPDIAWHTSGENVLSGDFHGQDEVFAYFGKLLEVTEGTFYQRVHTILGDDEHVVVLTDSGWQKPKPFDGHDVFVWHMKDGRATECWAVQTDQAGANASLS
ncbi:MAG: nuclear transport factor 2 family protein [Actinomycetes bacterium]